MTRVGVGWLLVAAASWLVADYSLQRFVGTVLEARRPVPAAADEPAEEPAA